MTSFRKILSAVALALVLAPIQAAAASPPPDRIDLPNGWQPEGITSKGQTLYVGSLADGAIWRGSTKTGEGTVLAEGAEGRVGVGIDHDPCHGGRLWVAGGSTNEVRVHNARTGEVLRTYAFGGASRFLNDVALTPKGVFVTDSMNQELAVVPFERGRCKLPAEDAAVLLPLTGDLEYEDGFNLNGIVRAGPDLIAVQSNTGMLFSIDRRTGETAQIDLGGEALTQGDGLELVGDLLHVVRNRMDLVAVVELADGRSSGAVVAELTSADFDVPTTITFARGSLWAVNARFGTEVTPDTPYWITRLDPYGG